MICEAIKPSHYKQLLVIVAATNRMCPSPPWCNGTLLIKTWTKHWSKQL